MHAVLHKAITETDNSMLVTYLVPSHHLNQGWIGMLNEPRTIFNEFQSRYIIFRHQHNSKMLSANLILKCWWHTHHIYTQYFYKPMLFWFIESHPALENMHVNSNSVGCNFIYQCPIYLIWPSYVSFSIEKSWIEATENYGISFLIYINTMKTTIWYSHGWWYSWEQFFLL